MAVNVLVRKTDKAVALLKDGQLRKALAIFKTFRLGFTKEEKRTISIASETLNGLGDLYEQLGIDTKSKVIEAERLLKVKYLKSSELDEK